MEILENLKFLLESMNSNPKALVVFSSLFALGLTSTWFVQRWYYSGKISSKDATIETLTGNISSKDATIETLNARILQLDEHLQHIKYISMIEDKSREGRYLRRKEEFWPEPE